MQAAARVAGLPQRPPEKGDDVMSDMILICGTAAMFAFGYLIMKKIDRFLDRSGGGGSDLP